VTPRSPHFAVVFAVLGVLLFAGCSGTSSPTSEDMGAPPDGSSSPCALPSYPDASCTGVPRGTTLTTTTLTTPIRTANTVLDGLDIQGCVVVEAPGVIIRRSKISCANAVVVASYGGAYTGTGLTIEDSEIDCQDSAGTAVGDTNVTVRRVDIHGCENGFDIDTDFVIEDSYIHDLYNSAVAHTDGAQFAIGANVTIRHNRIYANDGTSAIIMNPTTTADALIRDNLLAGGAYTLYCPATSSVNVRVLDNHVSRIFYPTGGAYGPWTDCDRVAQATGNVWDDTAQPLAF
jgi:hypothetical protein